ncbi:NAD-dependent epimerase/dehydratase family protein [Aneurinibacillus terranovensis]|uniref:NAD-dependent epimerase/dehydratase family protein n=1 Tax=Aneurinibacillus terranovensis TaxID=278991 RepID=UPI0009D6776A|nr:NAD-dependent epimerase/dehydratase family protein [Aneurinibacillus terranovensis]
MRVLVTGGMGFLGRTLVRILSSEGHTVVSYDRRTGNNNENERVSYVQGDLADLPLLVETIRKNQIHTVIHTAAISHPYFSREIPYQTVMTNAVGTTHVFEACRLSNVKRVVNFSSECAYGNNAEQEVVESGESGRQAGRSRVAFKILIKNDRRVRLFIKQLMF